MAGVLITFAYFKMPLILIYAILFLETNVCFDRVCGSCLIQRLYLEISIYFSLQCRIFFPHSLKVFELWMLKVENWYWHGLYFTAAADRKMNESYFDPLCYPSEYKSIIYKNISLLSERKISNAIGRIFCSHITYTFLNYEYFSLCNMQLNVDNGYWHILYFTAAVVTKGQHLQLEQFNPSVPSN